MDEQFWEDKYSGTEQLFSGNVNGVLATEAAELPPGQALEVGCGEGADARWLARRGWRVTAIDISRTALRRAADATDADLADRISWQHGDPTATPPPADAFDLVSVQYFPLERRPEHEALRGLLAAVAPGGTLLCGSHDTSELPPDHEHGFDPGDHYQPADIAELLDDDWIVLVNETRPRTTPPPEGTPHTHDTVLRARRSR
ncbi:class I SAM-dependent methyltransferase [Actinopolyspora erythraea]|uniref:SAM-dependent methyltransferase n=1 Tax=Actinopolyspora erythraea TaxID=414996 RepID=A0A099D2H6_9ACTN|nr:class I SAM-dependent methyltransferase [Actinopolyspora erythraea]ASU77236.1 class I SAM-dependent methyltransferase [Actinopolyspora erythraea]KGI80274.1 SAM-dependent methyltransferase [Actinopolyspora erythraea]